MAAKHPRMQVFKGDDGFWYWHLRSRNGKIVAGGGEAFTRRFSAVRAARQVIVAAQGVDPESDFAS